MKILKKDVKEVKKRVKKQKEKEKKQEEKKKAQEPKKKAKQAEKEKKIESKKKKEQFELFESNKKALLEGITRMALEKKQSKKDTVTAETRIAQEIAEENIRKETQRRLTHGPMTKEEATQFDERAKNRDKEKEKKFA